ncbi:hypothetical protein HK104_008146 [Borealophlyctis nickersoniae]|nr:hypothetical protein HK104_008146 [Borealophlyctis nickersoniae]
MAARQNETATAWVPPSATAGEGKRKRVRKVAQCSALVSYQNSPQTTSAAPIAPQSVNSPQFPRRSVTRKQGVSLTHETHRLDDLRSSAGTGRVSSHAPSNAPSNVKISRSTKENAGSTQRRVQSAPGPSPKQVNIASRSPDAGTTASPGVNTKSYDPDEIREYIRKKRKRERQKSASSDSQGEYVCSHTTPDKQKPYDPEKVKAYMMRKIAQREEERKKAKLEEKEKARKVQEMLEKLSEYRKKQRLAVSRRASFGEDRGDTPGKGMVTPPRRVSASHDNSRIGSSRSKEFPSTRGTSSPPVAATPEERQKGVDQDPGLYALLSSIDQDPRHEHVQHISDGPPLSSETHTNLAPLPASISSASPESRHLISILPAQIETPIAAACPTPQPQTVIPPPSNQTATSTLQRLGALVEAAELLHHRIVRQSLQQRSESEDVSSVTGDDTTHEDVSSQSVSYPAIPTAARAEDGLDVHSLRAYTARRKAGERADMAARVLQRCFRRYWRHKKAETRKAVEKAFKRVDKLSDGNGSYGWVKNTPRVEEPPLVLEELDNLESSGGPSSGGPSKVPGASTPRQNPSFAAPFPPGTPPNFASSSSSPRRKTQFGTATPPKDHTPVLPISDPGDAPITGDRYSVINIFARRIKVGVMVGAANKPEDIVAAATTFENETDGNAFMSSDDQVKNNGKAESPQTQGQSDAKEDAALFSTKTPENGTAISGRSGVTDSSHTAEGDISSPLAGAVARARSSDDLARPKVPRMGHVGDEVEFLPSQAREEIPEDISFVETPPEDIAEDLFDKYSDDFESMGNHDAVRGSTAFMDSPQNAPVEAVKVEMKCAQEETKPQLRAHPAWTQTESAPLRASQATPKRSRSKSSRPAPSKPQRPEPKEWYTNPEGRLSPRSLSTKLLAEINLLEAIQDSSMQLAELERQRGMAIAQQEKATYELSTKRRVIHVLEERQRKHREDLEKAKREREEHIAVNVDANKRREGESPTYSMEHFESISSFASRANDGVSEERADETTPEWREADIEDIPHRNHTDLDSVEEILDIEEERTDTGRDMDADLDVELDLGGPKSRSSRPTLDEELMAEVSPSPPEESLENGQDDSLAGAAARDVVEFLEEVRRLDVLHETKRSRFTERVQERNQARDEEAYLNLRQRALEEQARSEIAMLRHERLRRAASRKGKENGEDPFEVLSRKLESSILARFATEKAEIQRLRDARLHVQRQPMPFSRASPAARVQEPQKETEKFHRASRIPTYKMPDVPSPPSVAASITEEIRGSASPQSIMEEDLPVSEHDEVLSIPEDPTNIRASVPKSSVTFDRRPATQLRTSPPSEEDVSPPDFSLSPLLSKLRAAKAKVDISNLERREIQLEASAKIAEELVKKKKEAVALERKLRAEERRIERMLDGISRVGRVDRKQRIKTRAEIDYRIVEDNAPDVASEEIAEDIETEDDVKSGRESISSLVQSGDGQDDVIEEELEEVVQLESDSITEEIATGDDVSSPFARSIAEDMPPAKRTVDDYAEDFESLPEDMASNQEDSQVYESDHETADHETADHLAELEMARRIELLKQKVAEHRERASALHKAKAEKRRTVQQQMRDTELRLQRELEALGTIIGRTEAEIQELDKSGRSDMSKSLDFGHQPVSVNTHPPREEMYPISPERKPLPRSVSGSKPRLMLENDAPESVQDDVSIGYDEDSFTPMSEPVSVVGHGTEAATPEIKKMINEEDGRAILVEEPLMEMGERDSAHPASNALQSLALGEMMRSTPATPTVKLESVTHTEGLPDHGSTFSLVEELAGPAEPLAESNIPAKVEKDIPKDIVKEVEQAAEDYIEEDVEEHYSEGSDGQGAMSSLQAEVVTPPTTQPGDRDLVETAEALAPECAAPMAQIIEIASQEPQVCATVSKGESGSSSLHQHLQTVVVENTAVSIETDKVSVTAVSDPVDENIEEEIEEQLESAASAKDGKPEIEEEYDYDEASFGSFDESRSESAVQKSLGADTERVELSETGVERLSQPALHESASQAPVLGPVPMEVVAVGKEDEVRENSAGEDGGNATTPEAATQGRISKTTPVATLVMEGSSELDEVPRPLMDVAGALEASGEAIQPSTPVDSPLSTEDLDVARSLEASGEAIQPSTPADSPLSMEDPADSISAVLIDNLIQDAVQVMLGIQPRHPETSRQLMADPTRETEQLEPNRTSSLSGVTSDEVEPNVFSPPPSADVDSRHEGNLPLFTPAAVAGTHQPEINELPRSAEIIERDDHVSSPPGESDVDRVTELLLSDLLKDAVSGLNTVQGKTAPLPDQFNVDAKRVTRTSVPTTPHPSQPSSKSVPSVGAAKGKTSSATEIDSEPPCLVTSRGISRFVADLLAAHLPAGDLSDGRYSRIPVLRRTALDHVQARFQPLHNQKQWGSPHNARARISCLFAATNEALSSVFADHARHYYDPFRHFHRRRTLPPRPLSRDEVIERVLGVIAKWTTYCEVQMRNVDALLIADVKEDEKGWDRFDDCEVEVGEAVVEALLENLLEDTAQWSAEEFLTFVNASPSPFHAVETSRTRLLAAGYKELHERSAWEDDVKPGGKYFFTRNKSSIVAFAVGGKYEVGNGFTIVGAHTDSPCFKVKPRSKKGKSGYAQVGVETYGGGLWHTWFDRDLGLAGRVILKNDNGNLDHHLVKIDRPILRIPTLAIHLDRGVNDAFKFNNEVQLTPILSLITKALSGEQEKDNAEKKEASGVGEKHHQLLLKMLSQELKVEVSALRDFELCLFDTQPSVIGGAQNEFIFSPRCDNLVMSYCSLTALINSTSGSTLSDDTNIRVVALFDNEEIGSVSAYGAASNLLEVTVRRLAGIEVTGPDSSESSFARAMSRSILVSADMAHAVHPNYPEKHEENHRPSMNKGVVIKQNANQRYATTAITTAILREVGEKKGVLLQEFVVRNDSPCGSTIGPMLSAKLGIRTIGQILIAFI